MWRVCACDAKGCICQAAFREHFAQCFDCWYGYHWYTRNKKTKPA